VHLVSTKTRNLFYFELLEDLRRLKCNKSMIGNKVLKEHKKQVYTKVP